MPEPASEHFEIVTESPTGAPSRLRTIGMLLLDLVATGGGLQSPGGQIISVRRMSSGEEVFRHIEDLGDDEGHLLIGLQQDLASMTVDQFEDRWIV